MKNFLILHTGSGGSYAKKIANSIKWLNTNKYPNQEFNVICLPVGKLTGVKSLPEGFWPDNTIIYARAAYPDTTSGWMKALKEVEEAGYKVINPVESLATTSNKLKCALLLQEVIAHPKTWLVKQGESPIVPDGRYVVKPITSKEQGARVLKLGYNIISGMWYSGPEGSKTLGLFTDNLGGEFVLQEFVPYIAIHRVIVINGKALPYTFTDRPEWHPENWKVSVCLNKTTMQLVTNPAKEMLTLAENAQKAVGASISFVDVFETATGYTMSEINSACNLSIHEGLAKAAGLPNWNIHAAIARFLVSKSLEN